jgi:cell division protein FtsZ
MAGEPASYFDAAPQARQQPAAQPAPVPPPSRPLPAQRPATRVNGGEPRIPGRDNGLFAPPGAVPPAAAPGAPPPRKSLFGIVTGAIRGGHQDSNPAPAPARQEPQQMDQRGEPIRANVRQAAGEEMPIDIPAFLRRQVS